MQRVRLNLRYWRTENKIWRAFVELSTKQKNRLRITKLCEWAGINLSTFYRHYQGVEDLARRMELKVLTEFEMLLKQPNPKKINPEKTLAKVLIFIYQRREVFEKVVRNYEIEILIKMMRMLENLIAEDWRRLSNWRRMYEVFGFEVVAEVLVWGEMEEFKIEELERHLGNLIYLYQTAKERLGYLR